MRFDLRRDRFVVWLRWVPMEKPPSPHEPPNQGIRVELLIDRNSVLGPTIIYRRELEEPLALRANTVRTRQVLERAVSKGVIDLQLVIHGSVANAPYAALYQLRDDEGEAIERRPLPATPLLQVQPSVGNGQWQVAGQASVRLGLELSGQRSRLKVVD